MVMRWLTASAMAIAFGVAALELSACLAVEPHAAMSSHDAAVAPVTGLFTDAPEPELPIGAENDASEAAALPRFTR
jgi:hypothetical protein